MERIFHIDKDGWFTASLTRLAFPEFCCDCGGQTDQVQVFQANKPFLRLGKWINIEGTEHVQISIPVCDACKIAFRSVRRKVFWKTFRLMWAGFTLGGVCAVLVISQRAGNGDWSPVAFLSCMAVVTGLIGACILGRLEAGRIPPPVQLRRYLPNEGTVDLRFRRSGYTTRVHDLMSRIVPRS